MPVRFNVGLVSILRNPCCSHLSFAPLTSFPNESPNRYRSYPTYSPSASSPIHVRYLSVRVQVKQLTRWRANKLLFARAHYGNHVIGHMQLPIGVNRSFAVTDVINTAHGIRFLFLLYEGKTFLLSPSRPNSFIKN